MTSLMTDIQNSHHDSPRLTSREPVELRTPATPSLYSSTRDLLPFPEQEMDFNELEAILDEC